MPSAAGGATPAAAARADRPRQSERLSLKGTPGRSGTDAAPEPPEAAAVVEPLDAGQAAAAQVAKDAQDGNGAQAPDEGVAPEPAAPRGGKV